MTKSGHFLKCPFSCLKPNDLFGEEILYEKTDALIGNFAYYNGNISAVKWEAQSTTNSQRSFVYTYDQLNRLTGGRYQDRAYQSTGAWGNADANDESGITYDINGNIETLNRYSSGTLIDHLSYSYTGNQLSNVSDAGGTAAGFNGTNTSAYSYDNSGNLSADPKKGVTITYNVFNKTDKITWTSGSNSGNYIRYTYDADAILVRKDTYVASTATTTSYDYIDGVVGQNLVLSYFAMPEGRVRYAGTTYTFEYFIRDHLGNVRVSFDGTGTSAVAKQENSYYPFGMTLPGNTVPSSPNTHLFNGGSDWQNDFSNSPDLYETLNRNYDPELGRFITVDPMAESSGSMTTYHFAGDDPIGSNDPTGAMSLAPPPGLPGTLQQFLIQNDAEQLDLLQWELTRTATGGGGGDGGDGDGDGGDYGGFWNNVLSKVNGLLNSAPSNDPSNDFPGATGTGSKFAIRYNYTDPTTGNPVVGATLVNFNSNPPGPLPGPIFPVFGPEGLMGLVVEDIFWSGINSIGHGGVVIKMGYQSLRGDVKGMNWAQKVKTDDPLPGEPANEWFNDPYGSPFPYYFKPNIAAALYNKEGYSFAFEDTPDREGTDNITWNAMLSLVQMGPNNQPSQTYITFTYGWNMVGGSKHVSSIAPTPYW